MTATQVEGPAATPAAARGNFLRESGWLMIANIGGGLLNFVVHPLARSVGAAEYGIFAAFLAVTICIPTMPLQLVFTQQTAKAIATNRQRELAGFIRWAWMGSFLLWLAFAVGVVLGQAGILARWHLTNPAALWVALPMVLFSIWVPMFSGVLGGQQNFLWLGWSMILNAVGRLVIAVVAVKALHLGATGMLTGVMGGAAVATAVALWFTRSAWSGPSLPFDWQPVLRQVVPLMLGAGAFQFLFTADSLFAKSYLSEETFGFYGSAGTLSRALMWLVGPLALVMFPRIVHSSAKGEKSNLANLVLLGTGILAVVGAIFLGLLGPLVVKICFGPKFVPVASAVLPWYAAAMVPLALANVLLSNLFARSFLKVVPALCLIAIGYPFALMHFHDDRPETLLKIMGVFNLMLFAACAWFTWGTKAKPDAETESRN
jgi:O-antigen/teichoic acid export membrane protein